MIALIKKSDDTKAARSALIEKYKITEKQANAILDMKLSRLTSLELGAEDRACRPHNEDNPVRQDLADRR